MGVGGAVGQGQNGSGGVVLDHGCFVVIVVIVNIVHQVVFAAVQVGAGETGPVAVSVVGAKVVFDGCAKTGESRYNFSLLNP